VEDLMKTMLALLASVVLAAPGCDKPPKAAKDVTPKTTDLGTGLNAVERVYGRSASALFDVVAATLKSYDLKIESDRHDELGGDIVALRADGHKVTVKITSLDQEHAQVSIRVAPGNRNLAEMIHQRILEKLGLGGSKSG
jgi:hypothetical protein